MRIVDAHHSCASLPELGRISALFDDSRVFDDARGSLPQPLPLPLPLSPSLSLRGVAGAPLRAEEALLTLPSGLMRIFHAHDSCAWSSEPGPITSGLRARLN